MNKKIGIIAVVVVGVLIISGTTIALADSEGEKPNEVGERYGCGRRLGTNGIRDDDGDGIPNGQDEDYERPEDCEGYRGMCHGQEQ